MTTRTLPPLGALVRRHDPDRFFTSLFAPPERRERLWTLYAFNHEIARAREVAREPFMAMIRLQWWREVVEGAVRQHEVATPLGAALRDGGLERADLLAMIAARETEAEETIPSTADFLAYVDGTAGTLAAAAARALGAEEGALAQFRALGAAYGIAGILRGVGLLARQGRVLLPEDALARQGLSVHDVTAERRPEAVVAVQAELAGLGRELLRRGRGRLPAGSVAAGLTGVLARRDLARPGVAGPRGLGDRLAVVMAAMLRVV